MPGANLTAINGAAWAKHNKLVDIAREISLRGVESASRRAVNYLPKSIPCPRIGHKINAKTCAECRKASALVPAIAAFCGTCHRNKGGEDALAES